MLQLTEKESQRIQVLRGLAIIAVVLIHNTPIGLAQVWCRPFLNFSVGLFLFLSGLMSSMKTWKPFRRIKKVIVPYVIWTAVYVTIRYYKTPSQLPGAFLYGLLTGNSAAIMYYVFIYCELTLLIPFIDRLARSKYKFAGFAISPLEIIIMRLIPLVTAVDIPECVSDIMDISCLAWFVFFYIGYLLGNGYLSIHIQTMKIIVLECGAIALQVLEGYIYYNMGEQNCGTQLKLTSIVTGILFALLAYRYIFSANGYISHLMHFLGDRSFGIYFSHIALMTVLGKIPYYKQYVFYPLNGIVTVIISALLVHIGNKVFGQYAVSALSPHGLYPDRNSPIMMQAKRPQVCEMASETLAEERSR